MKQILQQFTLRASLLVMLLVGAVGSMWGETTTGTITFGPSAVKISGAKIEGQDNLNNNWTITTVGTTSFTNTNNPWSQIGSSKAPATSITFTTTLPKEQTITSFSAKFGGFSGTAGTITLKVGDTSVGTGSLNAANDVTVSSTTSATGKVLTVTVTDIAKGVKAYYVSYTYDDGAVDTEVATTTTINVPADFNTDVYTSTEAGQLTATVSANGEAVTGATVTWESSNQGVATIANDGTVTLVAAGTTTITASYAGEEGRYKASEDTYELTVTDSNPEQPTTVEINMNYQWLGSDNGKNLTKDDFPVVKTDNNVTTTIDKGSSTNYTRGDADYIRLYNGSSISFAAPTGYVISGITFTTGGNNTWNAPTVSAGTLSQKSWTGNEESVTFTMTGSCFISQATITLTEAGSVKPVPELSFSQTTAEATLGSSFTAPTLTTNPEGLTVEYSSSDTGVATVDASTGAVTLVAAGTTTITATFEGNDSYSAANASYTLTVSEPEQEGNWVLTSLSDLTASDVFVIVGNNNNNYALSNDKGTSAAPTAVSVTVSSNYLTGEVADNIKWNVSGNASDGYTFYPDGSTTTWLYCTNNNNGVRVGTNTSKTFKVDNGYLKHDGTSRYVGVYNSQDWRCYTSTDGNIANQTFTFYKFVAGAPKPNINANDREIAYNITNGDINFEVINSVDGGVVTASTEATWLTLGEVSASSVPFTATENESLVARTAQVVLTYTYGTETSMKTITITQTADPSKGTESNPYTVTEALEVIAALADNEKTEDVYVAGTISSVDEVSVYDESTNSGYGNATYFITDGTNELEVFRGYFLENAKFTATDQIQEDDEVVVYGQLQKYVKNSVVTPEVAKDNYLFSLTRPEVKVTLNAKGYATYASTKVLDFKDAEVAGYTAWQVTGISGTDITFEQITGAVAAGTGVLLKGEAGAEITMAFAQEGTDISATNKLVGITEATAVDADTYYGLKGEQFLKVKAGTVPAGKALLPASIVGSTGSDVKALSFNFGGIVTSIDSMNADNNAEIYNLAGQRVEKMQKGIYVVGGKKMLVK